ncbi:MAG: hypothetical protein A2X49_13670 [Lentisphaerae bacterium GWF2_52_8]|nr:MAG: hypothetical protein A2X49_13670 [Lentisphaerae bacterium GWF2_52_8]
MDSQKQRRRKTLRSKLGTSFAMVAILLSAILSLAFYWFFRQALRDDFRERLVTAVGIAVLQIDGELHSKIIAPGSENSDAYLQIKKALQKIRAAAGPEIRFVYTMRLLPDGSIIYVADAEPEDSKDFSKVGDLVSNIGPHFREFWRKGGGAPYSEKDFLTDEFGTWITGNAMIHRADGTPDAVLAMDISAERVLARERNFLWLVLGLFVCTIPLALFLGWLKGRNLAAPITILTEEVEHFDEEHLEKPPAGEGGDDETGDLARAFNRMTSRIKDLLERLQMEIIERSRAQESLREAEEKFMDILYASDHAILLLKDGRFVDANDSAARIFGHTSRLALTPADPAFLSPPRQPDGSASNEKFVHMCAIAKEKGAHRFEWQYQRLQGQLFTADISLTSMILQGEECLCCVVRDISDAKRLEEARRSHETLLESLVKERTVELLGTNDELRAEIGRRMEIEKELEGQRAFLRLVLDSCPDLIFIKNSEGRFTLVNRAMGELYDLPPEKIIGHLDSEFIGIPDELAAVRRADLETLNSLLPVSVEERVTLPGTGEIRWYQSVKIPFSTSGGERQVLGVAMDITSRKANEALLHEAKEIAESAARAKAEFLANMTHEIRTPLNAVLGMAGILAGSRLSHEQRGHVRMIRSSASTLLETINEILDFSHMERVNLELENSPFSISDCVEEVFDMVATRAAEKNLDLVHELPPQSQAVLLGDHVRVRQLLLNLVGNAVKFTERGEVSVSVKCENCDGEDWLSVSVSDTGIGIPEGKLDCLFKSFSQVDSSISRKYGGTGLGLAICARLVELMNGRIWVKSKEGEGSVFSFNIPLRKPEPPPALSPDEELLREELSGRSAVIVCKSAAFADSLARTCADWGVSILHKGNSDGIFDGGLPLPDLLLVDAELFPLLVLRSEFEDIPKLLLCRLGEGAPKHLKHSGRFAVLEKPVRRFRLARTLLSLLNDERFQEQAQALAADLAAEEGSVPLRFLVAEDNLVNQKVTLAMLQKMGYVAELARNGLEVLACLRQKDYDFILMDLQMPEMDGFETARLLSEWVSLEQRPCIIALTAYDLGEESKKCIDAGMDACLSKPLKVEDLEPLIAKILNGRTKERPIEKPPLLELKTLRRHEDVYEGFSGELGAIFKTDIANGLALLPGLFDEGRLQEARDLIHGLKGASSSFGATALAALCATAQKKASEKDLLSLRELLPLMISCHEQTCKALAALRFIPV